MSVTPHPDRSPWLSGYACRVVAACFGDRHIADFWDLDDEQRLAAYLLWSAVRTSCGIVAEYTAPGSRSILIEIERRWIARDVITCDAERGVSFGWCCLVLDVDADAVRAEVERVRALPREPRRPSFGPPVRAEAVA